MKLKEMTIQKNDAGQRLDKFLSKNYPKLPPSLLNKYIRIKRIKCNGKRCQNAQKLLEGDNLQLYINDELLEQKEKKFDFLYASKDLQVIYEDGNILLADKKQGVLVHDDNKSTCDTLINRIKRYLYEAGEYDPKAENAFAPALCNRIDRNTSGIVLAAKNAEALRILNEKIKARELEKHYLCIVHGAIEPKEATLTAYLTKDEEKNQVRVFDKEAPGSKRIVTAYRVLAQNRRYSLLDVDLKTGRTHQIRAHFAHIGHPLVGDTKYGRNAQNRDSGFKKQALYSYRITFAFKGDAGSLTYLNGKTFEVPHVDFYEDFMAGKIR